MDHSDDTTSIYGLTDPRTGELRYVGKADNPAKRLIHHWADKADTPKRRWLDQLAANNQKPELILLEKVPQSQWKKKERTWIGRLLALGVRLLNIPRQGGKGATSRVDQGERDRRRFWSKVDKRHGLVAVINGCKSRCWERGGAKGPGGYAIFHVSHRGVGKNVPAHRWAYEHSIGPVPKGYHVHHRCRNRICVRPSHLVVLTPREHKHADLKTHCKWGHPFSGGNLITRPNGVRACRICEGRRNHRGQWQESYRIRHQEYEKRYRADPVNKEKL